MRIHTNNPELDHKAIRDALKSQQDLGRIAQHVSFKTLARHRSQSHMFAFEIQLEADVRDNGRRAGNSGSYGAMRPEHDGYAATFDEWGWLLAALYELDPRMVVGTPKSPVYAGKDDFSHKTGMTYFPDELLAELTNGDDAGDPYPIVTGQASRTKRGYMIGRRGANRMADNYPRYWPHKTAPRTADEVRAFAWPLDVESSASVQHFIETGHYLPIGEAVELGNAKVGA